MQEQIISARYGNIDSIMLQNPIIFKDSKHPQLHTKIKIYFKSGVDKNKINSTNQHQQIIMVEFWVHWWEDWL